MVREIKGGLGWFWVEGDTKKIPETSDLGGCPWVFFSSEFGVLNLLLECNQLI